MIALKSVCLPFAVTIVTMFATPAFAVLPTVRSFDEIEFRSDPAALVGEVRADLASQIPAGSAVADAEATLAKAGAKCRSLRSIGTVRCRYHGNHFQGDVVESITWTVDLATAGETVRSFTVERFPAG